MLRNVAFGGIALIGGAITGIAISSWATPPLPLAPEVVHAATIAEPSMLASTSSSPAKPAAKDVADNCSPWDVSDVAMEAALEEMIRRGWRPPSQAEAIASFDSYGSPGVEAVEPGSPVPVRAYGGSASTPERSEEAPAIFPIDRVQRTSEGLTTSAPPVPALAPPALTPPPAPIPPPAPAVTLAPPPLPSNLGPPPG